MKIAVDMMGGDNAPASVVEGAVLASADDGIEILLVGDENTASELLGDRGNGRITVVHAPDTLTMCDAPSSVLKSKSGSSMAVAAKLVAGGEADAMVSAGNTGALFTAASIIIRRIPGVRRAAIGTVLKFEKPLVMLDMGANIDSTPEILDLYARMGSVYAETMLGIEDPRVGLLNNGSEEIKGTELYRNANALMRNDKLINFVGNCEGSMIPYGFCDVLVCDGFSGNICLKTMEGMSNFILRQIKQMLTSSLSGNIAGLMVKNRIGDLRSSLSSKNYGGAPILGIKKPVIKAHGNSDAKAISVAIKQARRFAESGAIDLMIKGLSEMGGTANE